jgi:hypothetical protein
MKTCCTCHKAKPLEEFSRRQTSPDGRQPRCRACAAAYYKANRDRIYPQIKARSLRVYEEAKQYVWRYLSEHPCVDCGQNDPILLEFDHVRGVKRKQVSRLVSEGRDLRIIQAEIDKCDVRCAYCHRRKTARELGWYSHVYAARARLDGHPAFTRG